MSENPYQAPSSEPEAIGVRSGKREDLRKIAIYQKGIQFCILLYFIAVACQFGLPPELRPLLALLIIPVLLAAFVFVLLLAMKVYNPVAGVFCAIMTLVPCIGLIVLLGVNQQATSILTKNGYKVGLMGANLSQFDAV